MRVMIKKSISECVFEANWPVLILSCEDWKRNVDSGLITDRNSQLEVIFGAREWLRL